MKSESQTGGNSDVARPQFSDFQPGTILGGRYKVVSLLGAGGMGVVYRVNQIFIDKQFALKTIDRLQTSDVRVRRFQQEARASFAVNHPNIIAVNDFGLLDDGTPFLVMELIEGETLGERLKREGRLSVDEVIQIFVQACFGLAYAHDSGIVHRDIKPSNIMILNEVPLSSEGSVKIVDFGIAKFAQHDDGEFQALTRTGEVFGSPLYMSPEQCSGENVDYRADVYSLGCVLFEALTSTPPFVGDSVLSTMMQHLTAPTPTLKEASLGGEFPAELEAIVTKMLEKSPAERYQNLGVVAHHLAALKRGETIVSEVASKPKVVNRASSSSFISANKFYGALLGTCVATALVSGSAGFFMHDFFKTDRIQSVDDNLEPHFRVEEDNAGRKYYVAQVEPLDLGTFNDNPVHSFGKFKWSTEGRANSLKFRPSEAFLLNLKNFAAFPENSLVELDLQKRKVHGTFANLSEITVFGNMQRLLLNGSDITDDDLSAINKFPALSELSLDSTAVHGAALANMPRSKLLTAISFNHCQDARGLLQGIKGSSALYSLSLDDDNLTSEDVDTIRSFPNLRVLHVSNNNIHNDVFVQLANLNRLQELYVEDFQPDKETMIVMDHMRNNGLQKIFIKKFSFINDMQAKKWRITETAPQDDSPPSQSVANGFNFPPDISLGIIKIGDGAPASAFGAIPASKTDKIHFYTRHASHDCPELLDKFGNDDLTGLDVIFTNTQKVIETTKNWNRLEELSFFNTLVKALSDVHEESPITNKQLPELDKFKTLNSLGLCGPLVSGDEIAKMSLLKRIKTLKLRRISNVDPLLKALKDRDNIQELWLVAQKTDSKQLEPLTQMKNLHTLRIRRSNLTPDSLAVFSKMPALKHLIIDKNSWSQSDKKRFRKRIPGCEFEPLVDVKYWVLFNKR